MENDKTNGRGGARDGAGRKPKERPYAWFAEQIEARIIRALPAVVDKIIEKAMNGDLASGKYLCDRILGKCGRADHAHTPADEEEEPADRDLIRLVSVGEAALNAATPEPQQPNMARLNAARNRERRRDRQMRPGAPALAATG